MNFLFSKLRSYIVISHDIAVAITSLILAFQFRFNFSVPFYYEDLLYKLLFFIVPIQLITFYFYGIHKASWRYVSIGDIKTILFSILSSIFFFIFLIFFYFQDILVPRSIIILDLIFLFLLMVCSRFFYRIFREFQLKGYKFKGGKPVIIFGSGQVTINLIKQLINSSQWKVIAIMDDNHAFIDRKIFGIKVINSFDNLPKIIEKFNIEHGIISFSSHEYKKRNQILKIAKHLNLNIISVPTIDDLISGKLNVSQIQKINVEDLLQREIVSLDTSGLKELFFNNSILVTGAGGSIGSELCRQILIYKPSILICVDIPEYETYKLEQELQNKKTKIRIMYLIGDIKDSTFIRNVLEKYQPKVVFHAAAYKHVPLLENNNLYQALLNNVYGTYVLSSECKRMNIDKFILISTDKAVNPTNIMGASKRLAEMVCQGIQKNSRTSFIMVRFGNVLGSRGSVIPKFRSQIIRGGPVTVTHPEITRYFMSIPEASQLVMQAGLMGQGGEIFVLDMGEPVKIIDLAKEMIRLSGFDNDEIKINFSGLRPGEKLYEELLLDDEHTLPTPHKKLRIALARKVDKKWVNSLIKWILRVNDKDSQYLRKEIKKWVVEYRNGSRM